MNGPSRTTGKPRGVTSTRQVGSKGAGVFERRIGRFNNIEAAWAKIVDLYHSEKITSVVFVYRNIYNSMPLKEGKQYKFVPGDVIGQGLANPIDHGGWTLLPVIKDRIHRTLALAKAVSHQGPVELFVDEWKDGIVVAKVVPLP